MPSSSSWTEPLEPRRMLALTPLGGEFHASTHTTDSQAISDVAADADGDFVLVWRSDNQDGDRGGIYGQRYNAAGAKQGGEFRVNTVTAGDQRNPSVAMDDAGNFVVVWEDSTSGKGIMGQRFNAAGVAQGGEFRVISSLGGGGIQTEVAMNGSGAFVVTYRGVGASTSDQGIFARVYNASGGTVASAFRINTDLKITTDTSVAMDDSGNFVVAWSQYYTVPAGTASPNIFARRYNAAGAALDAQPVTVNTYNGGEEAQPTVAMLPGGGYVVAYADFSNTHDGLGNSSGVYAQRFDGSSQKVGPEFRVGTYLPGEQASPSIAADSDGTFAVTWHGAGATGTPSDIHVQLFDAEGNPVQGSEQRVNTYLPSNQYVPAAAISDDNQLTIAWHSFTQDPDGSFGIYAQRYTAVADVTPPVVTSPQFMYDRRPAPALRFQFNKELAPASVQNTDLELTNLVTGETIPSGAVFAEYDNATRTITFTFPGLPAGALPDGNYRARLLDGSVADTGATPMENEYDFPFFALAGDANRDRRVDQADENILNANFGNTNATFAQGDFNYDGTINQLDRDILQANRLLWIPQQGQSIPVGYAGGKTLIELRAEPGGRLAVWSGTAAQLAIEYRFPTAAASELLVIGDYPGELSLAFVGMPGAADTLAVSASQTTFPGGFVVKHSLLDHILFDGRGGWDALTLLDGAHVRARGDQQFDLLALAPNASLDVRDSSLFIRNGDVGSFDAGAYTGVTGQVARGHNGGAWNGNGLRTSMPDAAGGLATLGVARDESDPDLVVVKYTYAGDANLDGAITGDDYSTIDFNIAVPNASGYANGDFNYDGIISGDDYSVVDFNIVAQGPPLTGSPSRWIVDNNGVEEEEEEEEEDETAP